jgi:hypothetical protein
VPLNLVNIQEKLPKSQYGNDDEVGQSGEGRNSCVSSLQQQTYSNPSHFQSVPSIDASSSQKYLDILRMPNQQIKLEI